MNETAAAPYPVTPAPEIPGKFSGPRMVVLGFIAYNFGLSLEYGVYGVLIGALQREFSTGRALAASGLGVMSLVMGLMSPLAGRLLQRRSVRSIMIWGALLKALGFLLLAFSPNIGFVLGTYALIIGPGVCLLGLIAPATLISNWYIRGRGRALGITNVSALIFLMPPVAAHLLAAYGLRVLFVVLAAVFLALIPLLCFVVSRPEQIGQKPLGIEGSATPSIGAAGLSSRQILSMPEFWYVTLAIGTLTAGAVMMVTHLVPMVTGLGFSLSAGSALMSAYGIATAAGTLAFGWLVDRIGAIRAILLNALVQIAPWVALLLGVSAYPALFAIAVTLGVVFGCLPLLLASALSSLVGRSSFSQAFGIAYFIKIPFMFVFAPLAGYLFDRTGTYFIPLLIHLLGAAAVSVFFLYLALRPAAPVAK